MEVDDGEVKTIVQELLTTKSLATLSAAGCPLSKVDWREVCCHFI